MPLSPSFMADYGPAYKAKLPDSQQAAASANAAVSAPSGNNATTPNPYDTSNLPFQGIYNEDQAAANKAYQDALAGLQQQRTGYNLQYGFRNDGSVDPNNQVGLFQLQRGSEARDLEQARNDSVGRGIGSIGLGAQAENQLHFQQDAADSNLLGAYRGLLTANDQAQLGASQDLQNRLLEARRKQIQNAIDAGYFTPQTVFTNSSDGSSSGDGGSSSGGSSSSPGPSGGGAKSLPKPGPKDALARYLVNNKPAPKKKPVVYQHSPGLRRS